MVNKKTTNIQKLPLSTIHSLKCAQVIPSISAVVKELIENSLDACSSQIIIKLDDQGLKKIEVQDNGSGIPLDQIEFVALPHYTSKISSYLDLNSLSTLGFRGEAINSICAISEFCLRTKTCSDELGRHFYFDNMGNVQSSEPCHLEQGTTVTVKNLFKNMPVRLNFYKTGKKLQKEIQAIKLICVQYGIINPNVKIMIYSDKQLIWNKPIVDDKKLALIHCLGSGLFNCMDCHKCSSDQWDIVLYMPRQESDLKVISSHKPLLFVNSRPVQMKIVDKLVLKVCNDVFSSHFTLTKLPFYVMDIKVSADALDVNVNPAKSEVFIVCQEQMMKDLEKVLLEIYHKSNTPYKDSNPEMNITQSKVSSKTNILSNECYDVETFESPSNLNACNLLPVYQPAREVGSNTIEKIIDNQRSVQLHDVTNIVNSHITDADNVSNDESKINSAENPIIEAALMDELLIPWSLESESVPVCNVESASLDKWATEVDPNNSKDCLNIKQMSLESWCKGKGPMEPVHVLMENPVPIDTDHSRIATKRKSSIERKSKVSKLTAGKAFTLVHDKPIPQPKSAFHFYCEEIRPQLLNECTDMNFTVLSKLLADGWKNLSDEAKIVYRTKEKNDNERYRIAYKKAQASHVSESSVPMKTTSPQYLDNLALPPTQENDSRPILHVAAHWLKRSPTVDNKQEDDFHIIGKTKSSMWIARYHQALYVLNSYRLEELYVYKYLRSNFRMNYQKLETPILLESSISKENQSMILNLKSQSGLDGKVKYISDDRLVSNGIHLKITQDEGLLYVHVTDLCNSIPSYGVPDILEIFGKLRSNPNISLYNSRPHKVNLFLQAEAMRISRNAASLKTIDDMNVYLANLGFEDIMEGCLHNQPIAQKLIELSLI